MSKHHRHSAVATLPSVAEVVAAAHPGVPLHCLRPHTFRANARRFTSRFPGDVLYAVKCNPEPAVLRALWAGGIRHFDAASAGEVRLVRRLFPKAAIHFMHPVKSREAIREAFALGVRDFALDSADELDKILEETASPHDLGLMVRLAPPRGGAVYDLSGKFGAPLAEAAALLRLGRAAAPRVGLCFHVGSQCLEPAAYGRALALAGRIIAEAGVPIDVMDVGGGFPVSYPEEVPPPLDDYLSVIAEGVARLGLPAQCRLWSEPGRALVAPGQSVVVQVLARRDNAETDSARPSALYINDGVYGALSDAGTALGWRFPVRLIPADGRTPMAALRPFEFFGPTCDSADRMRGPFQLPADVTEGDWIEIGQLGAYGSALRTAFNGFDQAAWSEVRDPPLLATPGYLAKGSRAA
ncbi:lysine/ornithine decarboxylase [mine drainage metagenome]|uniref:ornithine decarboxylase n=1 Tax=mine drainage metagenome TaxID=410659 RepID=A0A1J5SE00_9ZZZZ